MIVNVDKPKCGGGTVRRIDSVTYYNNTGRFPSSTIGTVKSTVKIKCHSRAVPPAVSRRASFYCAQPNNIPPLTRSQKLHQNKNTGQDLNCIFITYAVVAGKLEAE